VEESRDTRGTPGRRNVEERLSVAEEAIGHHFADRTLLRTALTHPSFNEDRKGEADYERLEFLGDAVIGLVTADILYERFPEQGEGGLTRLKIGAVSGTVLSEAAQALGLADAILLGESERGTRGRGLSSALENVFEALTAALYLDAGFDAAREFVLRALGPYIGEDLEVPRHPKNDLQELLQARGFAPVYRLIAEEGPPHDRTFVAAVDLEGNEIGRGSGRSKREAETRAAEHALAHLALPTE
jgi:ribonuclease III